MKTETLCLAAAALLLNGCPVLSETAPIPYKCEVEERPCGGGDDDDDDDLPPPPRVNPPEVVAAVANLFRAKCADCHGKGNGFGGVADIFDVDDLKRRALIAEAADASPLFRIVASRHAEGRLNPITGRPFALPTALEIEFVREWLDAGAPALRGNRVPVGLDAYAQRLRADAASAPPADAPDLVYVDFHAAYNNNRFSNDALFALVNATVKALGHLDVRGERAGRAGASVVVDDDNLPLAVRFSARAYNLDKQRDVVDTVARLANRGGSGAPFACDVPAIPVLDFLHIVSSDDVFNPLADNGQGAFESGYSNIALRRLLVDAGLLAEGQLVFEPVPEAAFVANGFTNVSPGVDLYDALAAVDPAGFGRQALGALYNVADDPERIQRGCLVNSSAAAARRCIDRLVQSAPENATTYLAFDAVDPSAPNKDPFAALFVGPTGPAEDPLVPPIDGQQPFAIDGGQGIFQLKNRMLGFFAFDGDFRLVSNARSYAAVEAQGPDRPPFSSSSACAHCHHNFVVPFLDEMMPALLRNGPTDFADTAAFAYRVAQGQDAWDVAFAIDAQGYAEPLRDMYHTRPNSRPLYDGVFVLGSQYMNDLSAEDVVAEFGVRSVDELIDPAVDYFGEVRTSLSRDDLTRSYQAVVERLESVVDKDLLRGCVVRSTDGSSDPPPAPTPAP